MRRDPLTPDERAAMEQFVQDVRSVVASVAESLNPRDRAAVEDLIDHDEHGEALVLLANVLADAEPELDPAVVTAIRELSSGLVSARDLPPAFQAPDRAKPS